VECRETSNQYIADNPSELGRGRSSAGAEARQEKQPDVEDDTVQRGRCKEMGTTVSRMRDAEDLEATSRRADPPLERTQAQPYNWYLPVACPLEYLQVYLILSCIGLVSAQLYRRGQREWVYCSSLQSICVGRIEISLARVSFSSPLLNHGSNQATTHVQPMPSTLLKHRLNNPHQSSLKLCALSFSLSAQLETHLMLPRVHNPSSHYVAPASLLHPDKADHDVPHPPIIVARILASCDPRKVELRRSPRFGWHLDRFNPAPTFRSQLW
jgi:hypothetical protein